ncbi:hypothetical protein EMIHUDRAFT_194771 [Emiliania huxleyi CCMP1516]|nr:hypothetical protein EMIHUDRAFT_194771 [Emiliania huxleyi CCMP1516]EOD42071.1 hypothetical protein EMIHUDRAFT_194771 [Emiliania huxleyi CCMP1516]|eukprot:XP_005794500.1 hypothetical protein EMIHUDRAFT_194771 [Emiliania huxleyi CCMP1516]
MEYSFGFVGVGTMNAAIVRGIATLPAPPKSLDNQAVVDASDVVFVGVLPRLGEEVLRALRFSERHTVRACCAPVPPASVVRAIPLPPVAKQRGACVMTPRHAPVAALFSKLGTVVEVDSEEEMRKMIGITCLMGQLYAQQLAAQSWLQEQGVDAGAAARWVGAVYHTVSYDSATPGPDTFASLVEEQTPGGLNEQVLREMREAGASLALRDSLDDPLGHAAQGRLHGEGR